MIGTYLATLSPGQEDAVLTERLAKTDNYVRDDGCRCLVGVTRDATATDVIAVIAGHNIALKQWGRGVPDYVERKVGLRFDALCDRFGEERTNAAIRNRILSNQASRRLAGVRELVAQP